MPAGMSMPPPRPCSTRNMISEPELQARPERIEPDTKSEIEVM
jgi:hypothetical protein